MDAASKIFETIALLIDQAERGEIDPWDVPVIEVIDRYLSELIPQPEATPEGYAADLSQSGQAFLSASMLVLFKANTLMQLASAEDETDYEDDLLADSQDGAAHQPRLPLERQLRRRPAAMPPPKRRVTLQELIEQLQIIATQLQLAEKTNKTNRSRSLRQPTAKAMRAALELAHQENLTEVAGELEQVLNYSSTQLALEQNWLNLDRLVELWSQTKPNTQNVSSDEPQHNNRVSVFWALLLLSAQSKVELHQEEFYQEIKIRVLSDSEEAANPQKPV